MKRFHKTYCYFGQNSKRKERISLSNFDVQLQQILLTCLCFCVRIVRVVAVVWFQSARGVHYFLVWLDSKFCGIFSKSVWVIWPPVLGPHIQPSAPGTSKIFLSLSHPSFLFSLVLWTCYEHYVSSLNLL